MKKNTLKKAWVLFGVIIIFFSAIYVYITLKNKSTKQELLNIANEIVNENIVTGVQDDCVEQEQFSVEELEKSKNVIGKLIIPSIEINAPIKDGTSPEVLRDAIGHFSSSSYWNGNVCLDSHNRGTYANYKEMLYKIVAIIIIVLYFPYNESKRGKTKGKELLKINQLNIGDEIIYQTKMGTRVFKVENIDVINESDVSVLNSTESNYLTLITCVKNQPELRLCLKAIEKI